MLMKKFTSSIIALAAVVAANATVVDFTYNYNGKPALAFGYNKKETLNIAIRINEPGLVGSKVTSMSVPVTTDLEANILGECSAFLTTELEKESKNNVANICTEPATITDGILTCTFSQPYTITEEGVYVGYTLPLETLSATSKYNPIAVVEGSDPNGLFIFSTRSVISWVAKSQDLGAVSAMSVTLDGDFSANAGSLTLDKKYVLISGKKNDIPVKISNYGSEKINSIEYTYTVGTVTATEVKELNPAIDAKFGAHINTTIEVEAPETCGSFPMEMTLTKVNGTEVPAVKLTSDVIVSPFVAHNRPLVEEFTGLGCGWCPRGYAALETLREEYPETFIALAYHSDMFGPDPMQTTASFPVNINGLPSACVNRTSVIDPSNLFSMWPATADKAADSNVEVDLSWADEEKTTLRATVKIRFLENQSGSNFRVGACLVEDDMTDPAWAQSNYYSTQQKTGIKILDDLFVGKSNPVYGLTFNDVMLSFPNPLGVANKLPKEIAQYEEVTYVEDFDLNQVRNLETFYKNPIQNIEKLRVVGVLFDKNGKPLNSGTSAYSTAGGELVQPAIANPVITAMTPAKDGNPAEITFTCPTTYGGELGILKPNGTPVGNGTTKTSYFRVGLYVNGEPYTFEMDKYSGLNKNESTIVYGAELGNTSFANQQMTVKVFADNIETIGVQSNYVYGKTTLASETIETDAKVEFSSIETVNAAPSVTAVKFYDLQGREISSPRQGQIVISRKQMTDGTVKASKIRL